MVPTGQNVAITVIKTRISGRHARQDAVSPGAKSGFFSCGTTTKRGNTEGKTMVLSGKHVIFTVKKTEISNSAHRVSGRESNN